MLKNVYPEELQLELDEMPMYYTIRAYKCTNCDNIYSEITKRNDKKRKIKCPDCKKHKLEGYICEVSEGIIQKDITTVGQQAELNTKRLGRYGKQESDKKQTEAKEAAKREALRQSKFLPDGTIVPEPLSESPTFGKDIAKRRRVMNMDNKQLDRYIKTGKE